jgi:hypothetical protein
MAVTSSGLHEQVGSSGDAFRTRDGRAAVAEPASTREDLVTVLFGACLVAGAMADGWAHVNIIETLEGFFTPWHGLLYGGFAATAGWTFWLAYQRRRSAPLWWRHGWPAGYRLGAIGVLIFFAGGLGDMIWHETLGIEVGLDAAFSPTHMLIDLGATLLVTSPLRSWWATRASGWRAVTGVASLTLGAMAPTILLTHSSAFITRAPTEPYDPELFQSGSQLAAIAGVDAYLVTTLLLAIPLLLSHRRRAAPGAATAVVAGVALFCMVMFEFPAPQATAALTAVAGAAVADVILLRLDAVRGPDAPLRLPIAGAVFAALVWSGHLLGLQTMQGLGWSPEVWTGVVTLTAILGALLGGLAARPASYDEPTGRPVQPDPVPGG